jgi:membrane-bound lytic murein transglycosylase B
MILEIILSTALSLTPVEKKVVDNLQTRLKKDGYDISQYVKDSRFQIYKFEWGKKFVNYADTTKCWYMKADSIEKCADFVKEYYFWLNKVEEKYGPSPEHITSQLQLETNRGQNTGERPVINSLISMYLNRPDRRIEFYKYIKDFLDLFADTSDNIIYPEEIFEIKGSWAGAYGIAQGMPEAIKKYGKYADGDGDGFFDPMNIPDAICFMALYLSDHGFKKNSSGAIQKYNGGHPFYGSSIGKHIKKLEKVMDKRERIPITGINCKINPIIINTNILKYNKLQEVKMNTIIQQVPLKQPFIKRIIPNRKIGKR